MDTPRYRIGNDLTIFWAINNRDGSPYDLDGKEVRLFMTHERGREEVEAQITKLSDGVRNNVIRWDFKAEDQRILGKYTLTFVVLESDTHRELTKDYGEAFTLVGRSEMENEEGDVNISIGGDLILSTKLDIYRIQATNVDVAGLKNQIYDVEKGLTTKVERKEFDEKTGEFENAFVKVETSIKGINTEIKDASGEITQIKQSIDGIEVSVGDLEYKVESLEKQTDGAIEKWFYPGPPSAETLPESNWKTEQEKYSHLGDLYYDEDSGIAYRYITKDNLYLWVVIEDADIVAALEAAKNNNRTFIDQPKTPYKVGDLWIAEKNYEESGIKQDDIVVCVITREEGQFDINDWQKKGNAINDEDLENFVDKYYEEVILPEIGKQIDGQAASYYGPDDPSLEWEAGTEADHKGDLWFNTNNNQAYYWSGSEWEESEVPKEVFDKIDGKNTIFVSIPEGKDYKENDLWFVEKDYNLDGFEHRKGVILVALEDALFDEATQSYQFKYADWVRRDTYTDDTAVANLDEYIKTGFKNGILDEGEKGAIESAWDSIVLAQDQLTQDYQTVILPSYTLPEFTDLKKAYKAVYNDQPSTEYPNRGTFQLLGDAVTAILNYVVTEEESTLPALIEAYDNAYDAYRTALSNYTIAYGKFTNAIRAELGQANEYIEAIIDDGKLTPIEKKQLVEVYKSLTAEYSSNVDAAFTAKIWKYNDAGNEVPGAYAGPKGVGQDYFDTYVAYKDAYSPIVAAFTGSDWGFDKMDETTTFGGSVNLSQLDAYFDAYYEALRAIARVISAVAEEKAEASLAMKEYMDDLEEVLTPTEAITQVGKGVVLSSVIGVGTYDEQSGKYLLKAGMNATAKNTADLITVGEHGRIVFVGGANGKKDWNQATFVVYEDGYVRFRAGKIDKDVQLGNAIIQSVIADQINLLSWPEYDEATGQTKLTPLFSVNTEKDSNGRDKIVSISALYDMYIGGNLVVRGDTSTGGTGSNPEVTGTLLGIKVNGVTYDEPVDGILTIPDYPTSLEWSAIEGKPTKVSEFLNDSGYITSAALVGYATQSWVEGKGYITGIDKSMVASAVGASGNAGKVLSSTGGDLGWVSLPTSLPASDVYAWAKKSSLALADVPDLSSKYLSVNGGTINGTTISPLKINTTATDENGINFLMSGVSKAWIGYSLSTGAYIYESSSGMYICVKNGTPYYGTTSSLKTLIHSGNIGSQTSGSAYALHINEINNTNNGVTNSFFMAGFQAANRPDTSQNYSTGITLHNNTLGYTYQLAYSTSNALYSRRKGANGWESWKTIAFTDSNVASATKLATARTIWGQSFDGTGNVSGALSNVGAITRSFQYAVDADQAGNLTFKTNVTEWKFNNSAGSTIVSVNGAGNNVGIGLNNPVYKLDVNGSGRFGHILLNKGYGSNVGDDTIEMDSAGATLWMQYYHNGGINMCYGGGQVTMGGKLSVAGAVTMSSTLSIANAINSTHASGLDITACNGAAAARIYLTTGAFRPWLSDNGLVDLGISGARWKGLYCKTGDFSGAVTMSSTLSVSGKTTINNNLIVAGDTSSGSDIRFKDKLSDHRIALSDIADAPLFTFRWNDREDDSVHLGSSAQYWEKVAPWLVKGEDFKTLDYSTLGVAIGISLANKTLNLEDRVKILEDKVKALEAENRRIQYGQLG